LKGEYESFKRAKILVHEFKDRIPESTRRNVEFTLLEAAVILRNNATPPLLAEGANFGWMPRSLRRLFRRSDFLRGKEKVIEDHQKILEKRMQVEGICSQALNRFVISLIRKMIIFGPG
jgi:hypothetical protein